MLSDRFANTGAQKDTGRAEGSEEAEAKRTFVAQRWILCAAQTDACWPRVEPRLTERADDDSRSVRILNLIDWSTRECLLIRAECRWSSERVIGALADVMVRKRVPEDLRSDNGPGFVAKGLRK